MKHFIYFILIVTLMINTNLSMSQNTSKSTIYVPEDYPTISEAIDAANEGDSVLVAQGVYYENINFSGKLSKTTHLISAGKINCPLFCHRVFDCFKYL